MNSIRSLNLKKLQTNQFIGISKFEKYLVNNYLLMAQSFEDYHNNTPISESRQLKYCMMQALMFINAAKFGMLILCDEPWLLVELGEFLQVFHRKLRIIAIFAFMCSLVANCCQAAIFYVERRRKFVLLDIFHQMMTKNRVEGMSKRLADKMLNNSYLMYKVFIEYQVMSVTIITLIITPLMLYQAYSSDLPHSPFRLAINGLSFIIVARQGFVIVTCIFFMFVTSIWYLKFTFMETLTTIERSIKHKSHYSNALLEHHHFSILLGHFSPYVNSVIGIMYNLSPAIMIISLQIMMESDIEIWKRCFIGNFFIIAILCGYYINKLATWFPMTNSKITNIIYPVYRDKVSISKVLKLDNFIAILNETFLGFYCFNMFQMTKLSFYKYLFGISVTYIMIMKKVYSV